VDWIIIYQLIAILELENPTKTVAITTTTTITITTEIIIITNQLPVTIVED